MKITIECTKDEIPNLEGISQTITPLDDKFIITAEIHSLNELFNSSDACNKLFEDVDERDDEELRYLYNDLVTKLESE